MYGKQTISASQPPNAVLDNSIANAVALQEPGQCLLHDLHFPINARFIHERIARLLAPGFEQLFGLPESASRLCHGDAKYREGAGGREFDGNESSRLIRRVQLRRTILIADEVKFPGMAFGRCAIRRGDQGVLIRNNQLGASIGRRNAAISGGKAERAFEHPDRFNVWLQLAVGLYKRDLHVISPHVSNSTSHSYKTLRRLQCHIRADSLPKRILMKAPPSITYDIYIRAALRQVWHGIVDPELTKHYVYGTSRVGDL